MRRTKTNQSSTAQSGGLIASSSRNELPIIQHGEDHLVDARLLHKRLNVGRQFTHWIQERIKKYDFQEGSDFFFDQPNLANVKQAKKGFFPGHNRKNYYLTLDMAKELAMLENNEEGRKVRKYLISLEKEFRKMVTSTPVTGEDSPYALLEQHTRRDVQVGNSRNINGYMVHKFGVQTAIEYNRADVKETTGIYPSEWKEIGKKIGLPSGQRSSGKEVIRCLKPEVGAQLSLNDELVLRGMRLKQAIETSRGCVSYLKFAIEQKMLKP